MYLITTAIIILVILWILYHIKKLNEMHIDGRGYERDGYNKLVHRKVAWNNLYDHNKHPKRFGEYDIHHIDRNKLNNHPSNLKILTRNEHKTEHGI